MLGLGGLREKWVHSGAVQALVGGGLEAVSWATVAPSHAHSSRGLSTGMTEHTKSLLRAFYELSQTHRCKGAPKLAA